MAGNPGIHILLTRPERQSQEFAVHLREFFGDRLSITRSPLLTIRPVAATPDLHGVDWILFTSVNSVTTLASLTRKRDIPALCVGERTARSARENGFSAKSADGNVNDLAELATRLAGGSGGVFFYPRGRRVAGDIAGSLREAGMTVRELVVYEQVATLLNEDARKLLASGEPLLLPLFSPRSAELFMQQSVNEDLSSVVVICISENTARALNATRFSEVRIALEPTAAGVTQEIAAHL